MSKNIKALPLDSCTKCKNFTTKPIPTSDSFERPEKWICGENGVVIDGYHDNCDKDPGIPDGCPLDDFKPKKKK